ncbi:MAG: ABC transporter permease subunit [Verrucomicrobiota bacterium]
MIVLPVVERELRVAARQPRTYRDRAWMAVAFTFLCLFIVLAAGQTTPSHELGKVLFLAMGAVATFGALLFGPFLSADSLSSEKREGTLGLLFLTDLKAWEIILGKLATHGLTVAYQFLGALPVLALPLLLGGVTWNNYARMILAVLNAAFFSLAAGYFISAISQRQRTAIVATFLWVGWFTAIIPLLEAEWAPRNPPFFSLASPFVTTIISMPGAGLNPADFWPSFWTVHLLGWLWLAFACLALPRQWQEKGETVKQVQLRERLTRWSLGNSRQRAGYRAAMLDRNPVCWLDDRYRLQKTILWAVLLGSTVLWMWNYAETPYEMLEEEVVVFTVLCLHYGLLLWIAFNAPQRFADDHASGALELLLATPIAIRDILRGRWLALQRQFGWALACIVVADVCMFAGSVVLMKLGRPWWDYDEIMFWLSMGAAGMIVFVLNAFALAWTSLCFGLTARRSIQASARAALYVIILHWIYLFGAMGIGFQLDHWNVINFEPEHALAIWFFLGLINSAVWMLWARRKLLRHFRHLASEPAPVPWWVRLVRRFIPRKSQG